MPRTFHWNSPFKAAPLSPFFNILPSSHPHPYLKAAIGRYQTLIVEECHHPIVPPAVHITATSLGSLTVSVTDDAAPLQHGVDESYVLSINSTTSVALISSNTVWGAMRGLETFSQLTWDDPPIVATDVYISDAPIFPHRGVLLDTSRNYYPVKDIMRTIAAMSANKLNVFHWHITDAQSFPILLPSEPELAVKGSYGYSMQYLPEDVVAIVEFAMSHGVRVMPEIDVPGHTSCWSLAYPEIITCAGMFSPPTDPAHRLAAGPVAGQLNPMKEDTYKVVKNVIRDVASLFPETFYHSGADEVSPHCWMVDDEIKRYIDDGGTITHLLKTFIDTIHPYITSHNRTVVYWEDIILGEVVSLEPWMVPRETTILQTWNNGTNNTKRLVEAGYRVIVSSAEFYYLDCGHGQYKGNNSIYDAQYSDYGTDGGSWCGPFKTWQRIYDYDITHGLSEEESKLVLGGEVNLWSEQADGTVLDARLWPRASAFAEAMWSGNRDERGSKRYAGATDRLNDWRFRMVGRGIRAEPIQPLWCRTHPRMCNVVY